MASARSDSHNAVLKAVRVSLLVLVSLVFTYLLAYGPIWSLTSRGVISWNVLQTLYRPVPIRAQRFLHRLWKPTGLFAKSSSDDDASSAPPAPSSPQK